ncbi:MAG: MFS transporter [Deltaproteobacteria bacterium]|nr:MFS transporter [Deltaproteobacteria bacterium]
MKRSTARWILLLLTAINFVNYMDRFVIAGMYDALHTEFGISNAEFGLLTTITFGLHAATTIPFGWLADRWNRRWLVFGAVASWSIATILCAVVKDFWMLAALRGFVGLAEAAYGPVSIVILCEIFPEEKKAQTIGIYNVGMFLGTGVGLAMGASLSRHLAFIVVGAPGLALGALALIMPVSATRVVQDTRRTSLREKAHLFWSQLTHLMSLRTLRWMLVGGVLVSFSAGGYITFVQTFVARFKPGFTAQSTGITLGVVSLIAGASGLLVGGMLADRLQKKYAYGRLLAVALGFLICTPFGIGTVYLDDKLPFLISAFLLIFFMVWYNGPISAVIDDCVDPKEAASAQAAFNFVIHLLGTAPAGIAIGAAADASPAGSRLAFVLPTIAALAGVAFFFVGCRHVRRDMDERNRRVEEERAAGLLPAA